MEGHPYETQGQKRRASALQPIELDPILALEIAKSEAGHGRQLTLAALGISNG
jgi:hypothetical protein